MMTEEMQRQIEEYQAEEARKEAARNAIRASIRECEVRQEELTLAIRELTEKIELQQEQKGNFVRICGVYENGRQRTSNRIHSLSVYASYVKMVEGHVRTISERVDGMIANNNIQRLESMQNKMEQEIDNNMDKLSKLELQLVQCNQQIEDLYAQLERI